MDCPNCNAKMDREDSSVGPLGQIIGHGIKPLSKPEALYECPDCSLQATWVLGEGLTVTWDSKTADTPRPPQKEPTIWGSGSARIPAKRIGEKRCLECRHNEHEPAKCDRCNCGESEVRTFAA